MPQLACLNPRAPSGPGPVLRVLLRISARSNVWPGRWMLHVSRAAAMYRDSEIGVFFHHGVLARSAFPLRLAQIVSALFSLAYAALVTRFLLIYVQAGPSPFSGWVSADRGRRLPPAPRLGRRRARCGGAPCRVGRPDRDGSVRGRAMEPRDVAARRRATEARGRVREARHVMPWSHPRPSRICRNGSASCRPSSLPWKRPIEPLSRASAITLPRSWRGPAIRLYGRGRWAPRSRDVLAASCASFRSC